MSELSIYKSQCEGVFGLNGYDENSATYALGWTLKQSPALLQLLFERILNSTMVVDPSQVTIELQKTGLDNGFTDIEIRLPSLFHIIVEAKKGWELPKPQQLRKYISRFSPKNHHGQSCRSVLLSMSAVSEEIAQLRQPPEVAGYPLEHLSWGMLRQLIKKANTQTKGFEEKLWLRELEKHIKGYDSMRSPTDNMVYCVVLSGNEIRKNSGYTWVDVVTKDNCYFHPLGVKGWPATPPNYIAFRRKGRLMSVHYVEAFDIVSDLQSINENWPSNKKDCLLYHLGPPMKPEVPLKNGNIYNNQRLWCALDTLLSGAFETIAEARDESKRRIENS